VDCSCLFICSLVFHVFASQLSDISGGLFFFIDPAATEIYTLSLHDALPISLGAAAGGDHGEHPAGRGRAGHGISSSIRDRGGGRGGGRGRHSSPTRRMTGATRCTPWR